MQDFERIRTMTKLAIFEQRENRMVFRVNSYMKKDYVALHVIYTLLITGFTGLLMSVALVLVNYNYFLEHIQGTNIVGMAFAILAGWLVLEICFGIFAYFYYSARYKKCKKKMKNYISLLKKLDE